MEELLNLTKNYDDYIVNCISSGHISIEQGADLVYRNLKRTFKLLNFSEDFINSSLLLRSLKD